MANVLINLTLLETYLTANSLLYSPNFSGFKI